MSASQELLPKRLQYFITPKNLQVDYFKHFCVQWMFKEIQYICLSEIDYIGTSPLFYKGYG